MRARALALPNRSGRRWTVGRAAAMPSSIGSIETVMKFASGRPAAAAQARASSMCTCSVCREGSVMAVTFSGPSARAAIASDSAESMPPDRPIAARLRPAPSTTSRSRRTLLSSIGASCSRPRSRCTRSSVPPAARISRSARSPSPGSTSTAAIASRSTVVSKPAAIASSAVARTQ